MSVIHTLLRHSIDYAGLFPPAELDMPAAVDNYAAYLSSPASWALGRFVFPTARIAELEAAAERHLLISRQPAWRLAALLGPRLGDDLAAIATFNERHGSAGGIQAPIDTVELKAASPVAIEQAVRRIPHPLQAYIEIPIDDDPTEQIAALGRAGARAKVRTGGVTPEAFPESRNLVRFMAACITTGVPFKATAGLHHPLRAEYRLTYAPDSPYGAMFGFLNLFLAAAYLRGGMDQSSAQELLEERSLQAFQVGEESIVWRGHSLAATELQRTRDEVLVSFGSCSFTEPIHELEALGLLESRVPQT
jgi:hypothetical protein